MFALQASTQIQMKVIRKKKTEVLYKEKKDTWAVGLLYWPETKQGFHPPLVKLWLIGLEKDPLNSFRKKLKERKLILLHPTYSKENWYILKW